MELEELKKTWKRVNDQLQEKELVNDEELIKLIQQKKETTRNTINLILSANRNIFIGTVLLMLLIVFIRMYDGIFLSEPYFWTLVACVPPALGWSMYTMNYLKCTNIEEMDIATVIGRVNKYNYWMSMERITGSGILLVFALIYFTSTGLWNGNFTDILVITGIWIAAFMLYLWMINKYTFKRLKRIRKNLNELKELKNIN